jgi:hypothetical protein
MPSQRRQINIRLTEESEARLQALMRRMRAVLGFDLSQSDVIQAGLAELEKRYPPGPGEDALPAADNGTPGEAAAPKGRKKGRAKS